MLGLSRYADVLDQIDPREGRTPRSTGLKFSDEDARYFLNALDGPVYLKSRVAKPLLLRLDLALSDGSAVYNNYPTISVEHVCPQTIETGSQWDDLVQRPQCAQRLASPGGQPRSVDAQEKFEGQ